MNEGYQKYNNLNLENEENKKQINYLKFNLKQIRNYLEKQRDINNKNKIIINSQKRTIEKYKKNIILNDLFKNEEKDIIYLNLSPKNNKRILHFNKSQICLKTNNNIKNNKEFSPSKNNIFSKNKNKGLKEIQIPTYESIDSDNLTINNNNLYTYFYSQKKTNSKSYKKGYNSTYNNFYSQN